MNEAKVEFIVNKLQNLLTMELKVEELHPNIYSDDNDTHKQYAFCCDNHN